MERCKLPSQRCSKLLVRRVIEQLITLLEAYRPATAGCVLASCLPVHNSATPPFCTNSISLAVVLADSSTIGVSLSETQVPTVPAADSAPSAAQMDKLKAVLNAAGQISSDSHAGSGFVLLMQVCY